MKMIGNVSDWLSYAGGALLKVADSTGSTVVALSVILSVWEFQDRSLEISTPRYLAQATVSRT